MSTTVEYNGVTMTGVTTRRWQQDAVYDGSGTDLVRHKFSLSFEGLCHAQAGGPITAATAPTADDAPATEKTIRARLLMPRGPLKVRMGVTEGNNKSGTTLLAVAPSPGTSSQSGYEDVDNGPKPQSVNITRVVGDELLRIVFDIECSVVECVQQVTGNIGPVLSNRWSLSEEMDENFYTVRSIRGTLRIANSQIGIQDYRMVVVPGLEDGFRRERLTFAAKADGLEADYEIVDRQVHNAAPWPATSISGRHTESTSDGVLMFTEVSVQVEGPPHVPGTELRRIAIGIIEARTKYLSEKNRKANPSYVAHAAVSEQLGTRNIISVTLKLQRNVAKTSDGADAQRQLFGSLLDSGMGDPLKVEGHPEYKATKSHPPSIYGYDSWGKERRPVVVNLLSCYLQMPCNQIHGIAKGTNPKPPKKKKVKKGEPGRHYPGGSSGNVPVIEQKEVPTVYSPTIYTTAIYTLYKMESRYNTTTGMLQLPLAQPPIPWETGSGDTATIVQVAGSLFRRVIRVEAERAGAWPQLPMPAPYYRDGTLSGTLLSHSVVMVTPGVSPDAAKRTYKLLGEYVYALNRPPTLQEKLRNGKIPFLSATAKDNSPAGNIIYSSELGT